MYPITSVNVRVVDMETDLGMLASMPVVIGQRFKTVICSHICLLIMPVVATIFRNMSKVMPGMYLIVCTSFLKGMLKRSRIE